MKKTAVMNLIKDLALALIAGLIIYNVLAEPTGAAAIGFAFFGAGIPFGWRWASQIITAVSLQGIGLKLLIALFLGIVAAPVVLLGDVIRCFTAPSVQPVE